MGMTASAFRTILLILCLSGSTSYMNAQEEGLSMKKAEKMQARKEKERRKGEKDLEKELRKRHLSLQDKATRKRLKRHDKRADRGGSGRHRDPFLKRIFGSKH